MRSANRPTASCLENPLIPETCRGPGGGERPRNPLPRRPARPGWVPRKPARPRAEGDPQGQGGYLENPRAPTLKAPRKARVDASKLARPRTQGAPQGQGEYPENPRVPTPKATRKGQAPTAAPCPKLLTPRSRAASSK
ncbi:hypothetical protein GCM10009533_34200 [Saccharopolyspora spinosporotrichia]|uniref:Uncharacterized protein n=1 Tax=Saccharopolyspora erythraea TaxID=1836 RepID=A0ABP3N047_SACER